MIRSMRYLLIPAIVILVALALSFTATQHPAAAATPPPAISGGARIDEPKAGASVRGTVRIVGTASVQNFQRYVIGIKGPGSNSFNDVGGGNQAVVNGLLFEWVTNPREFPDGAYTIRLRTVKNDGNYDEVSVSVRVDNATTPTRVVTPSATPGGATPTLGLGPSPTPILVATPAVIGLAQTATPAPTRVAATPTPMFGIDIAKVVDPSPWVRAFTTGMVLAAALIAFVFALFIARALLRWRP